MINYSNVGSKRGSPLSLCVRERTKLQSRKKVSNSKDGQSLLLNKQESGNIATFTKIHVMHPSPRWYEAMDS